MENPESTAQKLQKLRAGTSLSAQDVADQLSKIRQRKVPKSTYTHYESKKFKGKYIPADLAHDLVKVFGEFGIQSHDLLALAGLVTSNDDSPVASSNKFRATSRREGAEFLSEKRDLRVLGYVDEDDRFIIDDRDTSGGYVMRPRKLEGVSNAYAIVMPDDSGGRVYRLGELVYVNPRHPADIDDDVLVLFKDGTALPPRTLAEKSAKQVVVQQENPRRRVTIDRAKVKAIHFIQGVERKGA